jgi:FKBP-type peptidyl-prolyl cis-trans isomerase SlyD
MKIAGDTVVRIDYVLKNRKGDTLDKSDPGEPLTYLHGGGQIVPGLESALEGRAAGEKFDVTVAPKDGYGEREPEAIFPIAREKLPKGLEPKVGMELASQMPDGHVIRFTIVEVGPETVTADANHPLAGEELLFSIGVVDVRAATAEELAHGHVHGPGGAH